MANEYIEVVHKFPESLAVSRDFGPIHRDIADKIFELERTTGVHYHHGSLDTNFPDIPKDTTIRLGGCILELCVQKRANHLKKAGYQKVTIDKSISISMQDVFSDSGLL